MAIIGDLQTALIHMANKGQRPIIKMATAVGTAANAGGTTVDLGEIISDFHFKITLSSTTETVNVTGSVDGTNYEGILMNCLYTSSSRSLSAPADGLVKAGTYFLPLEAISQYRYLKFTKSSTSETVMVAYAFAQLPGNS